MSEIDVMNRTLTVMLDMVKPLNLNCSYAFLELLKSNLFLSSQERNEDAIQFVISIMESLIVL